MQEIRVAWLFGLHENEDGEPLAGGVWFPDTPENRRTVEIIVESGNEVAGEGSHWLEQRDRRVIRRASDVFPHLARVGGLDRAVAFLVGYPFAGETG